MARGPLQVGKLSALSCPLRLTACTAQLVFCRRLGVLLVLVDRRLRFRALVSPTPLCDDEGDDDNEDDDQHQQHPHPGGDTGGQGAHLGRVVVAVSTLGKKYRYHFQGIKNVKRNLIAKCYR